jgi:ECF sigma factor
MPSTRGFKSSRDRPFVPRDDKMMTRLLEQRAPLDHAGVSDMSEITQILDAVGRGEAQAAEQLLPLVYDELRRLAAHKLAQEKPGQTLEATGLVHEAYLRLVNVEVSQDWNAHGRRRHARSRRDHPRCR